jgi:hypothetical protein
MASIVQGQPDHAREIGLAIGLGEPAARACRESPSQPKAIHLLIEPKAGAQR